MSTPSSAPSHPDIDVDGSIRCDTTIGTHARVNRGRSSSHVDQVSFITSQDGDDMTELSDSPVGNLSNVDDHVEAIPESTECLPRAIKLIAEGGGEEVIWAQGQHARAFETIKDIKNEADVNSENEPVATMLGHSSLDEDEDLIFPFSPPLLPSDSAVINEAYIEPMSLYDFPRLGINESDGGASDLKVEETDAEFTSMQGNGFSPFPYAPWIKDDQDAHI